MTKSAVRTGGSSRGVEEADYLDRRGNEGKVPRIVPGTASRGTTRWQRLPSYGWLLGTRNMTGAI